MVSQTEIKPAPNSTFAKWRVEKVLVRSVFNLTFVASRQVEVPNPPIRKSSNRYRSFYGDILAFDRLKYK
jgi:hypothetical protein